MKKNTFKTRMTLVIMLLVIFTAIPANINLCAAAVAVPEKITLSTTSETMLAGDTFSLSIKSVTPAKAVKKISYYKVSSDNPQVVKVSNSGKVTAVKAGTATITVKYKDSNKVKASCKITVKDSSIELSNRRLGLVEGESKNISVKYTVNNLKDKTIKWTSSDNSIATVDSKGNITGQASGNVTITATNNKYSMTCTVVVTAAPVVNDDETIEVRDEEESNTGSDSAPIPIGHVEAVKTRNFTGYTGDTLLGLQKAAAVIDKYITEDMTDVKKARQIFDWICRNTVYTYSEAAGGNHVNGVTGILLYGQAVCGGYAHTFKFFMDVLDIPCYYVVGYVNPDSETPGFHGWNKLWDERQEEWVWVDVCWADPVGKRDINYSYFYKRGGCWNRLITEEVMDDGYEWCFEYK